MRNCLLLSRFAEFAPIRIVSGCTGAAKCRDGGEKWTLLGHKNEDITTYYSQVEIERLRQMVKLIENPNAHKMPTLKVVGV